MASAWASVLRSAGHGHLLRLRLPSATLRSARLRRESDTLETRTKLTSHSALDLGGLPRLPFPFTLHEEWRRPQV